jgi:hypothetical protein
VLIDRCRSFGHIDSFIFFIFRGPSYLRLVKITIEGLSILVAKEPKNREVRRFPLSGRLLGPGGNSDCDYREGHPHDGEGGSTARQNASLANANKVYTRPQEGA